MAGETTDTSSVIRSGRYIRQPTGYRAFIPAPLPPNPPINLSGQIQSLLSRADRALGRLDGSIHTLPNPDLFVAMYVRKEAVLSSQIEGTQSSLQDVLTAEAKILDANRPHDVNEVFNYIAAMNYGLQRLDEVPVSIRLIRELHERLLQGVRGEHLTPGELRTRQNWIGPTGCTLNEAAFVPPPPHEVLQHLSALEQFLHTDTDLPLLIKIGLAHAQFETIHPFLDGNGRIGRLLITFLLCERQVLIKPVLYLSWYFKRNRQDYYDYLQAVRDRGDWESWLAFFLTGIEQVSRQATDTARDVLDLRERNRDQITQSMGRSAANGHRVLEHLFLRPVVSIHDVEQITRTTYQAARDLVGKFEKAGILQEITGQKRNRRYLYHQYRDLFRDEPVAELNS